MYRRVKQAELDEERGKLESLQRELRNKLLALEGEGHAQRQHMMADFDEVRVWSCTTEYIFLY